MIVKFHYKNKLVLELELNGGEIALSGEQVTINTKRYVVEKRSFYYEPYHKCFVELIDKPDDELQAARLKKPPRPPKNSENHIVSCQPMIPLWTVPSTEPEEPQRKETVPYVSD